MRIKICGITQPEQGIAIAHLGATALGFICVTASPRYVTPKQICLLVQELPHNVDRIGVFANATLTEIYQTVEVAALTGIQLHGDESPEFCHQLRLSLPDVEIIKALRVQNSAAVARTEIYINYVNTLLLDAYHPQQLGGTGQTLDWVNLRQFRPKCPWLLAGGLTPDNVSDALKIAQPHGIDLSSGVERTPGDKDLDKVARLFKQIEKWKQR